MAGIRLILVSFLAVGCSPTSPVATPANNANPQGQALTPTPAPVNVAPVPSPPKWSFKESKDALTDAVVRYSSIQSTNTVNLKFPYAGEQRGTLTMQFHSDRTDVTFSIERGQLFPTSLQLGSATAQVRIDDTLIQCPVAKATGLQTEVCFLTHPDLPKLILNGRELRIEVEIFQEANQVFVFDLTSGR